MTKAPGNGKLCRCGRPFGHTGRHRGGPNKADLGAKFLNRAREEISRHHADIERLKRQIRARQDELLTVEARLSPLVAFVAAWQDVPALPAPKAVVPSASGTVAAPPASVPNRTPAGVAPQSPDVQPVNDEARPGPSSVPAETAPAVKRDGPATEPRTVIDPHMPTVSTRCSKCRRFRPGAEFIPGCQQCVTCRVKARTAPADPPEVTAEPVEAGFDVVAQWAGPRGITFASWEDLPRVNSKREDHGLPTFKRRMTRARPGRLGASMAP
jgi:hypothetical protein